MLKTSILLCSAAVAIAVAAPCSSLSSTEKTCTAGTFKPDNLCSGTTCVEADDVGDATKHCCRDADVTGKCDGNTLQTSNIDCSSGDGTTGGTANTQNKGATVTGDTKTACCEAVTVTGKCDGNTLGTSNIDCSNGDGTTGGTANTQNKGATVTGDTKTACCEAVTVTDVTGKCGGNTLGTSDIDCSSGDGTTGGTANTQNKGVSVTGNTKTACCEAVTAASTGALCSTGADLTPPVSCATGITAKASTSKCVGDPCVATDYTGTGDANLCCEVAAMAECSTLGTADQVCTGGATFTPTNDCAATACVKATDTGDAGTSCCVAPAPAGPLCTTGAGLTPALKCGSAFKAKAALTSKCVGDPCVGSDYTGTGTANLCCEAKASPPATDSGASSLLPNFLFAAAGLIALY